ncbi:MAG: nucleotidyl transferase AbiEii/AbiGii toxin family protein, partial [Candidatus Aminicenantes bacterium]|nr:nucleotidyl transferase AbiEii/AbiGii toxin family protein [Candidatus Aminicenantes bacterium]
YMIIGGQAVLLYGEPRLTKDIDITLGVGVEKLPLITEAVTALGLKIEADEVESFVKETMVLPTSESKSGIRVDFVFSFSPFEREAIARARVLRYDEVPVRFASLEDLIIHKVVAGRARDIEDVKAILLKNPDYDNKYIRSWLADFEKSLEEKPLQKFEEIVLSIQREAAKKLARLGGTAKDLLPIPRRRSRS